MKRLAIIGAGDLGLQIQHHASAGNSYQPVCFFDDTKVKGSIVNGMTIQGGITDAEASYKQGLFDAIIVAIGYNHMTLRGRVFEQLKNKIPFATIVHPDCKVDPTAKIGEGVVIYPGCIIDMDVVIGDNVLLNLGCIVSHHTVVGKNCFLSPAVKIAGFVTVSPDVILGINTTIIDNVTIAKNIKTAAGAVVIDNLQEAGLYAGVPATFKKKL